MKSSNASTSYPLIYSILLYGFLSILLWIGVHNFILSAGIMVLPLLFYQQSRIENKKRQELAKKAAEKLKRDALAIQISKKLDQEMANSRMTLH